MSINSATAGHRGLCTTTRTLNSRSAQFLTSYRLALATSLPVIALALGVTRQEPVQCAPVPSERSYAAAAAAAGPGAGAVVAEPAEAESIVNVRDLSFGTVAGICVGVFVKKGLKVRGRMGSRAGERTGG